MPLCPGSGEYAWQRGCTAQAASDWVEAARWWERARRISGGSPTISLALASAWNHLGDARALPLLSRLFQQYGGAELGLALVAAELRHHGAAAAAPVLHRLLGQYVLTLTDTVTALIESVTRGAERPGWLACCGDDLVLRLTPRQGGGALPRFETAAGTVVPAWRRDADGLLRALRPTESPDAIRCSVPVLGGDVELRLQRRLQGYVSMTDNGLRGWAWHPFDPDRQVTLHAATNTGSVIELTADQAVTPQPAYPTMRPKGFALSLEKLPANVVELRIGCDGQDLTGSPLRLAARAVAAIPRRDRAAASHGTAAASDGVPVLLLLHTEQHPLPDSALLPLVAECVDITVVADGAPPSPTMRALSGSGSLQLQHHVARRGAAAAWNDAAALYPKRDLCLARGDACPEPAALTSLKRAASLHPEAGVVGAWSNGWRYGGYPERAQPSVVAPDLAAVLGRAASQIGLEPVPATPLGACLLIRRHCFDAVGGLADCGDDDIDAVAEAFTDLAARCGWPVFVHPGAFVHDAAVAIPGALDQLQLQEAAWRRRAAPAPATEPLALGTARQALAAHVLAEAVGKGPVTLLVTHAEGGGVERYVQERCHALTVVGGRGLLLRSSDANETVTLELAGSRLPALAFRLPAEFVALTQQLARLPVQRVEIHHLRRHHFLVRTLPQRLGLPYEVVLHDYALICPRANLVTANGRYCREPDITVCERCATACDDRERVAPHGVAALRAASAALLAGAAHVTAPSRDTAERFRKYIDIATITVQPWELEQPRPRWTPPRALPVRVCVPGAIQDAKGYRVLLSCARDAKRRQLPLQFTVVGFTRDDDALIRAGAFVTGPYDDQDVVELLRTQQPHLGFIPSVWPETWCYALSAIHRAGLPAVCFDLGAQAERVRQYGDGAVIRPETPAATINDALINFVLFSTPWAPGGAAAARAVPVHNAMAASPLRVVQ